jgi:hypothetical protein
LRKHPLQKGIPGISPIVAFLEVTIPRRAGENQDAVCALRKGLGDKLRLGPAAAGDANDQQIRGIGTARSASGVGGLIRTPVAEKADDFGFKNLHHGHVQNILLFSAFSEGSV